LKYKTTGKRALKLKHLKLNSFEITFRLALEKRSSVVMRNKVPIIKPY